MNIKHTYLSLSLSLNNSYYLGEGEILSKKGENF